MGLFSNIASGFKNISFSAKIDDEYFEELEEQLIMADVGASTSSKLVQELRKRAKEKKLSDAKDLKPVICDIVEEILSAPPKKEFTENPHVILVIGVNGVGKTTSIGKLAYEFSKEGKIVMLGAADTFRAAAIEQLQVWGERSGSRVIAHDQGADPAAVVHDTITAGVAKNVDVIICDTAGRLHNKKNLMDELGKIRRVIQKELPQCVPQVLLVVDATTGQNAIAQAKQFKEAAGVDGVILAKLDGTAKGGVVIAISHELNLPVCYVGMGERATDLVEFDPHAFAHDLFGDNNG